MNRHEPESDLELDVAENMFENAVNELNDNFRPFSPQQKKSGYFDNQKMISPQQ